jgi:PAS domain S-box-containing protein
MNQRTQIPSKRLRKISDQVLNGIVQTIDAAVVVHDRQMKVLYVNSAFKDIYEIDEEDVIGKSPLAFLPDRDEVQKRAIFARLKRTLETGQRSKYHEFHYISPSGKQRDLVSISIPITGEEKAVSHVMSVIHDLTARKQLEQEAVRAAKLSSVAEMAYTIAHEINNPLTGIKLGLSTLRQSLSREENLQIVDSVMKDLNRIQLAVQSFLKSNRIPISLKKVKVKHIEEILRRVLFHLSSQFATKNITVRKKLTQADSTTLLDPDRLHQVFLNVLLNAVEAISEKGTITISSHLRPPEKSGMAFPHLRITFADTGKGIPLHHVRRIFEPFYTTKPGGTGLGLHVCREILHAHGGALHVESELGRGTEVHIRIPVPRADGIEYGNQ